MSLLFKATKYGEGTYFALDASYSADDRYSTPDSSHNKFMLLCRVLVGRTVLGNESMHVLPKLPGNDVETYDSSVNNLNDPTIFIIYNDNSAYPDYLIKFTIPRNTQKQQTQV